jgi:hypothetical protein
LLAIFHPESSALATLLQCGVKNAYGYDFTNELQNKLHSFFKALMNGTLETPNYNKDELKQHSASHMTEKQCKLFEQVIYNA